jgi:CHAT domain-containing protein
MDSSVYLIESFDITYAYSTNDLIDDTLNNIIKYPVDILAMAYSSKETLGQLANELQELNSSIRELDVIKKTVSDGYRAKYFLGYDCTKANFMKYASEARIIHMSTHGAYDPELRTSGMLYLRQGENIDSLCQDELRYRNVTPALLVLSACDSGAGKSSNEEGMFSIGRTFQAFGAKQAVTALWPLSGNASAEIFQSFYQHLFNGIDAQTALHYAKIEMIEDNTRYSLPGFWGSLTFHY